MHALPMDDDQRAVAYAAAVRQHRGSRSVRASAIAAGISEGRWRQIEAGYQSAGGDVRIPVRPRPGTVIAIATALEWDIEDALRTAGLEDHVPAPDPRPVGQTLQDVLHDLEDATPDEIDRVCAYVQGLKDARG